MEQEVQKYNDIWSIKDDIIAKNESVKKEVLDIPDADLVAINVSGYIINSIGNIVAKFGFFIETSTVDRIDLRISPDGFMGNVYNTSMNVIFGYSHPLGFNGLIDPKQSTLLTLTPDMSNGEDIIISISNDDKLATQGLICIIRDIDVVDDLLSNDIKEDFIQSKEDAAIEELDLNDIETSYNAYLRHLYLILGEAVIIDNTIEKEEIYE